MKKNLSFTKDDILTALIESMDDSFAKNEIVKNLLNAKLKRLRSDLKFEEYYYNSEYGSSSQAKNEWESFDAKKQKKHNNKIKKINTILKQINEYSDVYSELNMASFSNANMSGFKSKVKQVFKWEEQGTFDDLFKK
jgi:hypothetical protein